MRACLIGKRSWSAGPHNQVHDHSRPSFHASEVGPTSLTAGNAHRPVAAGQSPDRDRRRRGVGPTSMAKPANGPRSLSTGRLIWHRTLIAAFSEQSKSSWRFGVVPGHTRCANGDRTAEADVKSSSEEKLSNRFSTACPFSVALEEHEVWLACADEARRWD